MAFIKTDDYETLVDWLFCQSTFLHKEEYYLITVSAFRNLIFDMKPIYSGYASKAAIELHDGALSKMTSEHYNPRQKMSQKIVGMVRDKASKEDVLSALIEACKVHKVTSDENTALRPYQRKEDYVPEEAYAALKIELVPYAWKPRQKSIEVEGKIFGSAKEVAEEYNISIEIVRYRVASPSKKWVTWKYAKTS